MKNLIKGLSLLLIVFGIIDFILAEFMDIWITGQYYPVRNSEGKLILLLYWTPYVSSLIGGIFYYINIYFLKPKNVELLEGSLKILVSRYEGIGKNDGKLYITPEKITFEASNTIEIQYNEIQSVSKTKVMLIFPAIKIITHNDEFLFATLKGVEKVYNAILFFKKSNKIQK